MRISKLIAKCEDAVVARAPKAKHAALSTANTARTVLGRTMVRSALLMQRVGAKVEDLGTNVQYGSEPVAPQL